MLNPGAIGTPTITPRSSQLPEAHIEVTVCTSGFWATANSIKYQPEAFIDRW